MSLFWSYLIFFLAGVFAGAVNSVAGGGSLISFPSMVALGIPAIVANATNTAAIWPGSLSSAITYGREIKPERSLVFTLLIPSILGGLLGAMVLVFTPPALFGKIVPFLVLFATLLFASRGLFDRLIKRPTSEEGKVTLGGRIWGFLFQLFVATYGGYFGAGIGILMLGSFSIMGMRDILKMNGLKALVGTMINLIAFIFFAIRGLVEWPIAIVMGAGTILGGFGGARIARRINQKYLRWFVIAVGLGVSIWMYFK